NQPDHDKQVVVDVRMEQRAKDSGGHTGCGQDHPASGSIRMAQAPQAQNKQAGGDQVCGFEKILCVGHFFSSALAASFLRNIFSMRSVMRKPPVTLIMAEVTARPPRTSANTWCWL